MLDDIENVGIMQGFMDVEDELEDELEDDEDLDEAAEQTLNRRPDSPEILMNTLRGDMRSVDARRQELADLVGDQAAEETPDAVLAMLQPVLAQGGGLGALPQSGPMAEGPQAPMPMPAPPGGPMAAAPPGGIAPPMEAAMGAPPAQDGGIAALMGAGAPPGGGQAPINMAEGGLVQRFSDGSDEEGVTSLDDEDDALAGGFYSPEMVGMAEQGIQRLLSARPAPEVDVRKEAMEREKLYQDLLGGGDDSARKAQLLFSLAQTGLQFAGNVDAQGRRLTGSPASRFAAAAASVPASINQFIADKEKDRRTVRLAAIQAAEKEAEQVREGNLKQIESQRKLFGDILRNAKKSGTSGMFGKGGLGPFWSVVTTPGLAQAYADGQLTPDEDNMFIAAANRIIADGRPRKERYQDEAGRDRVVDIPGYDIPWLNEALAQRQQLDNLGPRPPRETPGTVSLGPPSAQVGAAPAEAGAEAPGEVTTAQGPMTTGQTTGLAGPTIWEMAPSFATVEVAGGTIGQNIPGAGGIASEAQQNQRYYRASIRDLIKALQNNPRYAEGERQAIEEELDLDPRIMRDTKAFRNSLIGTNRYLTEKKNDAMQTVQDPEATGEAVRQARDAVITIENFQKKLMPVRVYSVEEVRALPPGTAFFFKNEQMHRVRQ
jgi:hypothetical protein